MNRHAVDAPETLCPHCGAEADCHFTDSNELFLKVICPDCGHFEIPRAEFEQAQADLAAAAEPPRQ